MKDFFIALLRSWFELTAREQKAVILLVALFLLGVIVRLWHDGFASTAPVTGPRAVSTRWAGKPERTASPPVREQRQEAKTGER